MTYTFLNFVLFSVISILCAIIVMAVHTYHTGIRHQGVLLILLLTGLLGSVILVKSPKYIS